MVRNLLAWMSCIFALIAAHSAVTWADDTAPKDAANDDKPVAGESATDPYKVPNGTAEELLQFIDKMRGMRPSGENRKEMIESVKRAQDAMVLAADKILASKPDGKTRTLAVQAKLEALSRLSQFGKEGAEAQIKKLANELQDGSDVAIAKQAQSILLQLRARKLMMGETAGADELLAEVTKQLAASPDDMSTVRVALGIAQALEYSGKTDKLAIQAYHDFAEILSKSTNPDVLKYAARLEGVVRRLELVGKPIEITGTQLDGHPFDQASLKGKVVLVDFWATWCGPCVAEFPNVLENYHKYHDKGFEVVGISLDQDREALETFIKEKGVPWVTLFDERSEGEGNPTVTRYGVMGIPTVILVGADGNVVSLNARGEKLGELLAQLLGPVDEDSETAPEKASKKES